MVLHCCLYPDLDSQLDCNPESRASVSDWRMYCLSALLTELSYMHVTSCVNTVCFTHSIFTGCSVHEHVRKAGGLAEGEGGRIIPKHFILVKCSRP